MDKLMLCRICLVEDDRMYDIDTTLQGTYELLTAMPFERKDKPLQICYICCAQLHNCYKLQAKCLQSEEYFARILEGNNLKPASLNILHTLKIKHPVVRLNIPSRTLKVPNYVNTDDSIVNIKMEPLELDEAVQIKEEDSEAIDCLEVDDIPTTTVDIDQNTTLKSVKIVLENIKINDIKTTVPVPMNQPELVKLIQNKQSIRSTRLRRDAKFRKNEIVVKELCKFPKHTKLRNGAEFRQNKNIVKKICRAATRTTNNKLVKHTGEKLYKCDICMKYFSHKSGLTKHNRRHKTPYKCSICGQTLYEEDHFDSHVRLHTGVLLECDICGKRYRYKREILQHMYVHMGRKLYNCDLCDKGYYYKKHLRHHSRVHNMDKPYKCDFCEKCFLLKGNLTSHIRTHTGEKPYYCDRCGKAFATSTHLYRHILIHTGEMPYKCDICEKSFNQKGNLRTHFRKHTETPYK